MTRYGKRFIFEWWGGLRPEWKRNVDGFYYAPVALGLWVKIPKPAKQEKGKILIEVFDWNGELVQRKLVYKSWDESSIYLNEDGYIDPVVP